MKFSELTGDGWSELQPYLDTALLPVTGLSGLETPPEAAERIALTGEWLLPLETAFRGRTVTFPANHYDQAQDDAGAEKLNALCMRIKALGFRYLIVVAGNGGLSPALLSAVDLIVQPEAAGEEPEQDRIRRAVTDLWKSAVQV